VAASAISTSSGGIYYSLDPTPTTNPTVDYLQPPQTP
jgi:hypothetical protein